LHDPVVPSGCETRYDVRYRAGIWRAQAVQRNLLTAHQAESKGPSNCGVASGSQGGFHFPDLFQSRPEGGVYRPAAGHVDPDLPHDPNRGTML